MILKKNKPLISIIFPIYNYENNIIKSISTVLKQTYTNFELIIIDDYSEDNTRNLLKSINDTRIKLIFNEKTKGLAYCRNIALNKSKGKYIFYLNMNNFWTKKYLKTMLASFLELPDADAIYSGNYIYKKNSDKLQGIMFGVYNKSLLYNKNYISLSAFAHKKQIYPKIKFDETLNQLEDWYFLINISKTCKMYSVPIIQSKSYDNYEYNKNEIGIVHKKVESNIINDFPEKYALNKKISIIIPSYELLDDLKECIDKILSFNSKFIDIIIVDNNSNKQVRHYLKKMADENKIKYIQNEINYSFTYAVEQSISISDKNSDILILNNDAILTKGALESMQYHAYNLDNCGIIVPQEVLYSKNNRIKLHIPFANHNFECNVSASKAHNNIINIPLYHDGNTLELTFAPFFCTYIKRDVYNKTLGLDAELGRHYNSDRIFSDYVRHVLKLKVYHITEAKVYHKSKLSTKLLEEKNKEEYNDIFLKNIWKEDLAKELGFETPLWK